MIQLLLQDGEKKRKSNIATQHDAMFEAGDTIFQGPSFLFGMQPVRFLGFHKFSQNPESCITRKPWKPCFTPGQMQSSTGGLVVIPIIFLNVPQSSQTESLGFTKKKIPPRKEAYKSKIIHPFFWDFVLVSDVQLLFAHPSFSEWASKFRLGIPKEF